MSEAAAFLLPMKGLNREANTISPYGTISTHEAGC